MATVTAMSKKNKALAAIFSLVRSVGLSQELHARWWIPITERQAPNGVLILSSLRTMSALTCWEPTFVWSWTLFHELLFFLPIQLHIPRGYSTKFRGRVPPEVLRLILLYTIFDVISSMRRSVSSPDKERREEKRREKKSWKYDAQRSISFLLRNTTPFTYLKWQISPLFHILQLVKSLFFHLPKA